MLVGNSLTLSELIKVAKLMPPKVSILLRGESGIGKTQVVHQIARDLNLTPLILRLPLMSEGDFLFPVREGEFIRYLSSEEILKACESPCLVFLDEINRAFPTVQNYALGLTLERKYDRHVLHPKTRLFAAINIGNNYTGTHQMDTALLRRFWAADIKLNHLDWITWAKEQKYIPDWIINFIKGHSDCLAVYPEQEEESEIYPDPRKWEMLATTLVESNLNNPESVVFQNIVQGFLGKRITSKFIAYLVLYNKMDADTILNKWNEFFVSLIGEEAAATLTDKSPRQTELIDHFPSHMILDLNEKVVNTLKMTGFTKDTQMQNLMNYMLSIPREHCKTMFDEFQKLSRPFPGYPKFYKDYLQKYISGILLDNSKVNPLVFKSV